MKNINLLFILVTCAIIKCNILLAQDFSGTHFRNGDLIPYIENAEEWKKAAENKQPAWCYYNNDPANGTQYGKLFNWYAVADSRGLCPVGWHVPTNAEWTIITDYLGGKEKAGVKMKAKEGWLEGGNGFNSSGFNGLPGGFRYKGTFNVIGEYGLWWSCTETNTSNAETPCGLYNNGGDVIWGHSPKEGGCSVRCLMD